jgi:2-C-methyl-D-erythritol 4-phosphate cytidylyltransferase
MGTNVPKQYLKLHDKTIIEHSLQRLAAQTELSGMVVAISKADERWPELELNLGIPLYVAPGGEERCHSVLNALNSLAEFAADDDWVLVHDAARPCVRNADISKLINTLGAHPVGGLLGLPVSDTVKRSNAEHVIEETVKREGLWRALTPQMFRLAALRQALEKAIADDYLVTDDASAMEHSGQMPLMVEGHGDNIKITHLADLKMAEFYLHLQASENDK